MKKTENNRSFKLKMLFLLAGLLISFVFSLTLGRYPISLRQLAGISISQIMDIDAFWTPVQESLFIQHRLPRVLLACMVGAGLSAAGAAYQGVFQNPMAAPDILGASSGAAFGASLAILTGLGSRMIIVLAFCCSIAAVAVVIYTGNRVRGKRVMGLILSGIMIGSLLSSGTSFIKLVADPEEQLPAITYWLMGSLNGTGPKDVALCILPLLLGLIPMYFLRWRINILTFSDDEAQTMGVNAKLIRTLIIICATLVTAACVSVSGVIGWVGLVIPHFARRLVGNDYRRLFPVSLALGAIFLLLTDDISRSLFATEIPLGILTSFIGAPFFLFMISGEGDKRC